ncbi:MAG: glycerophosphodiester phosphodiesterase family protein [Bdellovibrionota bacterium]
MLVIAHRGANHEGLENSWQSFNAAVNMGCDRIELDVHLTKDNIPVVIHDDFLFRTSGVLKKVSDLTISELKSIRLKNGENIPLLVDVIEKLLPQIEINIELKGNSASSAQIVAPMIDTCGLKEKVIFSSFYGAPLAYLRDNYPHLTRACLWGDLSIDAKNLSNFAPQLMLEKYETKILHPHVSQINQNLMEQAHLHGWIIYAWDSLHGEEDVNKEKLWTMLKTYEINGLCTNYPRELMAWLKNATTFESALVSQQHSNYTVLTQEVSMY